MVKLRRIWLPKAVCRLVVEEVTEVEVASAAVGPMVMCEELAMSCRMPAIRDTNSCKPVKFNNPRQHN